MTTERWQRRRVQRRRCRLAVVTFARYQPRTPSDHRRSLLPCEKDLQKIAAYRGGSFFIAASSWGFFFSSPWLPQTKRCYQRLAPREWQFDLMFAFNCCPVAFTQCQRSRLRYNRGKGTKNNSCFLFFNPSVSRTLSGWSWISIGYNYSS